MAVISIFVIFFYLLIFDHVHAYYGDLYNKTFDIPPLDTGVAVAMEDAIYILGGYIRKYGFDTNRDIVILRFDSHQNAITSTITNTGERPCEDYCHAHSLGDNKTIVLANVEYPSVNITDSQGNVTLRRTSGISFYNIPSNTWINPSRNTPHAVLPPLRKGVMSAISPKNDAIYVMGGYDPGTQKGIPDIYRYDLKNTSSVIYMSLMDRKLMITTQGASSDMLPNGVIVIAFGMHSLVDTMLLDTSQVTLFNTRTNQIYKQNVSGIAPAPRYGAGSVLGPDKSTIYYYGGESNSISSGVASVAHLFPAIITGGDQFSAWNFQSGNVVPGLVALDTTTWTWSQLKIPGSPSAPFIYSTLILFQNTKLVVALGTSGNINSRDIGVIDDVPQSSDEIQNSKMRWFTNNKDLDQINSGASDNHQRLGDGAVAGIAVSVSLVTLLLLAILWRRFPKMRAIGSYVKNEIIWQPRSGEPLWTEAARLLVRFILLFLLLGFIVYSIIKSVDSPVVVQEVRKSTRLVRAPDIRFCFSGFTTIVVTSPLKVGCNFRNGTDCSSQIQKLDMNKHTPKYPGSEGFPTCFMFVSTPAHSFIDDKSSFSEVTGTKMVFNFEGFYGRILPFMAGPREIYINMYAPDYNPNMKAYQLASPSKVEPDEYRRWKMNEEDANFLDSIIIKPGVRSTASYDIIDKRILRANDGWNNVGFSSNYDETFTVNSFYKDSPPNMEFLENSKFLAQLTIQPRSFTVNTSTDQKVFTLLNAFAQIGGVLGLFVAVQTILFGYRPASPFGVIHRWSFGRLRFRLKRKLANYFDRMETPVPLVNPVSNRLSTVFNSSTYRSERVIDDAMSQEDRVYQLEERLQLMELLLKSYYLDDEVFRSLDQAVKCGHNEKRSSGIGGIKRRSASSVLANESNEMLELDDKAKADEESASTVGINRRSSGTVFPR